MPDKKIKLLHLHAPLRFGGGEVFLSNFYEASGPWFENRTILFSGSDAFVEKLDQLGNVPYAKFWDKDLVVGSMRQYVKVLGYTLRHLWRLRRLAARYEDSDFVIGHGFPFTVIIPVLHIFGIIPRRMKTVHFQHHRLRRPGINAFWRWMYARLLRSFDVIVVDAIPVREDIVVPLPELADKIFIIGTGIPFEQSRHIAARPSLAPAVSRILDERDRRTVAIYASRYVPHKNHKIFINLLEVLRAAHKEGALLLVFTGQEIIGSDFQTQVLAKGFGGSVLFTGSLDHDDVLRAMKNAHICMFPSLEEGFGLSILEALVMGLPTLVFRDAIPQELHPFLMLAGSEDEFVEKAKALVTNPGSIQNASRILVSQESALEYFDINNVLARFHARLSDQSASAH